MLAEAGFVALAVTKHSTVLDDPGLPRRGIAISRVSGVVSRLARPRVLSWSQ